MSMSIESSMGWRHAPCGREADGIKRLLFEPAAAQDGITPGKDAGSPRTYIAPRRSRESSSSPCFRACSGAPALLSLSRASALQPHSFLPRLTLLQVPAGSHRARALGTSAPPLRSSCVPCAGVLPRVARDPLPASL